MATYLVQVAVTQDSALARDKIVNTFHLDDHGVTSDPDGLAQDAAELFGTVYGNTAEVRARVYPTGPPPNYPVGEGVIRPGGVGSSGGPREVALCLSYYGERNLPRTRGRIYLCAAAASNITIGGKTRPSTNDMNIAKTLGHGIADLGGPDVDWIYFSTLAGGGHGPVKTIWVDDEWDTIRSRGLRATTRVQEAVNE
jgi:hypothetical protein